MRKILVCTADRAERGLLDPVMVELQKKFPKVVATWCELDSRLQPQDNMWFFAGRLQSLNPDIVVVPTDRNEMVYIAAHAFHSGYIVAHFHAGNNPTNHPDDLNRRAISCFSHIMFANMQEHKQNLIRQGEEEWRIHVVGSTAFDNINYDDSITPKEPFDFVVLHPDPTSRKKTERDLMATIHEVWDSKQVIWIYPNHDLNYDVIEKYLENQVQVALFLPDGTHSSLTDLKQVDSPVMAYKNLPRGQYLNLLKSCARAIGNSSSFYYELPVLNPRVKFVQIGERNKGLIVIVPPTQTGGSKRIAEILATIEIDDKLRNKRLTL